MPRHNIGVMMCMSKEQIEKWLLSKIECQIDKAKLSMIDVTFHLSNSDWKAASDAHRQVDYWLARIRNTQRLLDELE